MIIKLTLEHEASQDDEYDEDDLHPGEIWTAVITDDWWRSGSALDEARAVVDAAARVKGDLGNQAIVSCAHCGSPIGGRCEGVRRNWYGTHQARRDAYDWFLSRYSASCGLRDPMRSRRF
jgi:hypothetical protein